MGHIRIFMVPFLHLLFYTLQGIEQNKLEDLVLFEVNAISSVSVSHTEDIAYKKQEIYFPMRASSLVEKTDYKQVREK